MGTSKNNHNQNDNNQSSERRNSSTGRPPPGTVVDRRLGIDRRDLVDPRPSEDDAQSKQSTPSHGKLVKSKKKPTADHSALERRRGRGRRLSDFTKTAEEGEMNTEQFLFLMAIDGFKKANDKMFPTWTDVLEVVRLLGYRKTMPSELGLTNAEDWLEASDAPANVRPDRWAERFDDAPAVGGKSAAEFGANANKSEAELTDEALEAFEAAFGDEDFDSDQDRFNEAA